MGKIYKAGHVLEYVAFIHVQLRIRDSFVYMFVAIDAYSGSAFNLTVERDDSPETILKNVYFLMEHEKFKDHNTNGFTLVFEDNEALSERITAIIKSEGGKVMYNKTFNNRISNPFLLSLTENLERAR